LDGRLPKPNPILVRGARRYVDCEDWRCGLCTPKANKEKRGGKVEGEGGGNGEQKRVMKGVDADVGAGDV